MPIKETEKIWHNGEFVNWNTATLHVMSHVVNYGTCVFEGIRAYQLPGGPAIFRAQEHMQRLVNSAHIYRMELDFTRQELVDAMLELVAVNKTSPCYIRPIVLRGYGDLGVNPLNSPIEIYMANYEWGNFLATGGSDGPQGIDACVSTWTRIAPNTLPAMAKAGANYMNSQLIKMEATTNGYAEGIALDSHGYVSEGPGANLFMVRHGKLITAPIGNSVLPGITRDSVITMARDLGIEVVEQVIPREMLYIADEMFFCGTGAEITPVRSVDRIEVGGGKVGPITHTIYDEYFGIVKGTKADRFNWLTPVPVAETVGA